MLTGLAVEQGRLRQIRLASGPLRQDAIWLDLVKPSDVERAHVLQMYQQPLPTDAQLDEIEATSRFYLDEHGLHIHSYFIDDPHLAFVPGAAMPRNITASLSLNKGRLYSVHSEELAVFRMYRMRTQQKSTPTKDGVTVLLGLFETKVDLIADLTEKLYRELETAVQNVFEDGEHDMHQVLTSITRFEDLNGKLRLILLDTQRAMRFLLRFGELGKNEQRRVKEILRDVESLTPHTNYLFEKVNFLMDASSGIVNVQQNAIIKVMTLASVVFLPPTLIASVYGMNFHFMPELDFKYGYPLVIGLMVLSVAAPLLWFRRKGWLGSRVRRD